MASKTIKVHLAEVPTDVLVHLVDHGPARFDEIVQAIAPADADNPVRSINLALRLLIDGGLVYSLSVPSTRQGGLYGAERAGIAAVADARTVASTDTEEERP